MGALPPFPPLISEVATCGRITDWGLFEGAFPRPHETCPLRHGTESLRYDHLDRSRRVPSLARRSPPAPRIQSGGLHGLHIFAPSRGRADPPTDHPSEPVAREARLRLAGCRTVGAEWRSREIGRG